MTPLLECFRRGDVDREIRMLAARGALAIRGLEQLSLLVWLTADSDEAVARTASATLDRLPDATLARVLARSDTPDELREFFRPRGLDPVSPPVPETPDDELPLADDARETRVDPARPLNSLPVVERLKLAVRGSREQRSVLVRDANRLVAVAVLSSPKASETEIESFARMANVSEEVLRIIGSNRAWLKRYGVVAALVRNPKTPLAISLRLLPRLNERDLRALSLDRNVPEGVRVMARKAVVAAASRRR